MRPLSKLLLQKAAFSLTLCSTLLLSGCMIVGTEDDQTTNMRKDLIRRAVVDHANEVRKCYDYELKKDPMTPALKVVMDWNVDPEGHAQDIKATTPEASIGKETLNRCLTDLIREIPFPPPAKGQVLHITYPFLFSPEGPKK